MSPTNHSTKIRDFSTPELYSTSILVGASFALPPSTNSTVLDTNKLGTMTAELAELRGAIKQLQFGERFPLEKAITLEAHRFTTAREALSLQLNSLVENVELLTQRCKALQNYGRISLADIQQEQKALTEVTRLTQEHLAQTNSLFADLLDFKESAERLNLPGSTVALFSTILKTAREHAGTLLKSITQETGKQAVLLRGYYDSFQRLQSQLCETNSAPGYFQIVTMPRTENVLERSINESLLTKLQKIAKSVRQKFDERRALLSKTLHSAATLLRQEKTQQSAPLSRRLESALGAGVLQSIWTGKIFDALPLIGTGLISRRVTKANAAVQRSELILQKFDDNRERKIKTAIRKELAGTEFPFDRQIPKEILRAAIPLHKRDSLISMKKLDDSLRGIIQDQRLERDASNALILKNSAGEVLKIVNRGDGKMRLYKQENGIWTKLGSAWSDDALTIARRFLQNRDLGIISRAKATGIWYIPPPEYFDKLNQS